MEYRRFGDKIVARSDMGEDFLEKLCRIALLEDVKLAEVSALGTFSYMNVGLYDLEPTQPTGNAFEGYPCFCRRSRRPCVRWTSEQGCNRSDVRDGDYGYQWERRPCEG